MILSREVTVADALALLDRARVLRALINNERGDAGWVTARELRRFIYEGNDPNKSAFELAVKEKPAADPARILLVGGAGYLGSVLTRHLLEAGHQVRILDRLLFGKESLTSFEGNPALELVSGDIRDLACVNRGLKDVDAVIHVAALVGEPACNRDSSETIEVNYSATVALAQACKYLRINRFVFASTDSAYGVREGIMTEDSPLNPISLYARLKLQAENDILALKDDAFSPCVLRMATLYGFSPRMRFDLIINIMTMHAVTKNRIKIYGGKQWRPLVHVEDAARAYVLAVKAPIEKISGEVFNVGSNEQNYQIEQIGEIVRQVFPSVAVDFIAQPPDLRDYHVSFDKIGRTLGYRVQKAVKDGISDISDAILSGKIANCDDKKHCNA